MVSGTVVVFPALEVLLPLDVLPLVEVLLLPLLEDVEVPLDLPVLLLALLLFPPPPPLRRSKRRDFGLRVTNGMNIVESEQSIYPVKNLRSCLAGQREGSVTHFATKFVRLLFSSSSVSDKEGGTEPLHPSQY